jgi:hypothetical protein
MTMDRKPVSTRQRFEIFKRDGFTCQYCGSHPPEAVLHVDHIVAVSNGGENDRDNLITACDRCNFGKSNVPLSRVPGNLQYRMDEIREKERQIKGYSKVLSDRRERLRMEVFSVLNVLLPGVEQLPTADFLSVKRFVERLGVQHAITAAEKAYAKFPYCHANKRFRYFCGICWRWIREGVQDG